MKVGLALPTMAAGWTRGTWLDWCRVADEGPFASISTGERITSIETVLAHPGRSKVTRSWPELRDPALYEAIRSVRSSGESVTLRLHPTMETPRTFEAGVRPMVTPSGRGVIAILRDITESREYRDQLAQAHEGLEKRVAERTAALAEASALIRDRVLQQAAVAELGEKALSGMEIPDLLQESTRAIVQILRVDFCALRELSPDECVLEQRAFTDSA